MSTGVLLDLSTPLSSNADLEFGGSAAQPAQAYGAIQHDAGGVAVQPAQASAEITHEVIGSADFVLFGAIATGAIDAESAYGIAIQPAQASGLVPFEAGGIAAQPAQASGSIQGEIGGVAVLPAQASGAIDTEQTSSAAAYLVNVWRGVQKPVEVLFQEGLCTEIQAALPWKNPAKPRPEIAAIWEKSIRLEADLRSPWTLPLRSESNVKAAWSDGLALEIDLLSGWNIPARNAREVGIPWGIAASAGSSASAVYSHPQRQQKTVEKSWEQAAALSVPARVIFAYPPRRRHERVIPWDDAIYIVSLWPRPDHWQPPQPPPRVITPDIDFTCEQYLSPPRDLWFGANCGASAANEGAIPVRRVYIVIHDIEILRLPDNYPIHASRVSLGLDADSWAWGFSATLLGAEALDAVQPVAGEPVTLSVEINGHTWHCLVEDWGEDREFGKRGVSVKGRGLSAWLSTPYQLPGYGVTDSAMTPQQLMSAHLPLGDGWGLTWDVNTPDWLVPAGAWTWAGKSPIQAIHEAAQSVGMIVVPGAASRTLHVQPRYPVLPWNYAGATPDLIVPDAAIRSLSRQQAIAGGANAVFMRGGDVGGILARCYRSGTPGDVVAATGDSPLITDIYAARVAGGRRLAAQHQQPEVRSVTLPVGGVFLLGEIGQLMRVEVGGTGHLGIINSVSINAERTDRALTVYQTLTIGENTDNQLAKFRRLMPLDPLLVGNVETNHGDGTCTVILTGGGSVRVRGSNTSGQAVYVRSGAIESTAPSLSAVDVEI
jgi:hypothetical protein